MRLLLAHTAARSCLELGMLRGGGCMRRRRRIIGGGLLRDCVRLVLRRVWTRTVTRSRARLGSCGRIRSRMRFVGAGRLSSHGRLMLRLAVVRARARRYGKLRML